VFVRKQYPIIGRTELVVEPGVEGMDASQAS
jgi:hypothetical protein